VSAAGSVPATDSARTTETRPRQTPAAGPRASAGRGGIPAALAVALIVASVVPLAMLQLPNLLVSAMPAATLAKIAGRHGAASLVRACGLALPVMACAAPVAALLARRHRAWLTLLAGLIVIAAADLLGDWARTLPAIGADRVLHGLGAGIALPATLALAFERSPRWCRLLSRWWAVVAVISLLASVPLLRDQIAGGHWRAALQPFPVLTAFALAATALYVALAGGFGPPPRAAVTPAERSQLALIAIPVAGLAALDVGISDQPARTLIVSAAIALLALAGLAVATSADVTTGGAPGPRGRLCLPLAGAVCGFALAPTADAIGTLRPVAAGPHPALHALWLPLAAAAAACLLGACVAAALRGGATMPAGAHAAVHTGGRGAFRVTLAGLACAAAGLLAARAFGPAASQTALAVACALLAGGLATALCAGLGQCTPAGAMSGVSLMLAGAVTGYLAAAAVQVRLLGSLTASTREASVAGALTGAAGDWELVAASATAIAAVGVFFVGRVRQVRERVSAHG
jgi:hypothetical protein